MNKPLLVLLQRGYNKWNFKQVLLTLKYDWSSSDISQTEIVSERVDPQRILVFRFVILGLFKYDADRSIKSVNNKCQALSVC